jgi:hypothetical protein
MMVHCFHTLIYVGDHQHVASLMSKEQLAASIDPWTGVKDMATTREEASGATYILL